MMTFYYKKGSQTRFFIKVSDDEFRVDYRTWMNEKRDWAPVKMRTITKGRACALMIKLTDLGYKLTVKGDIQID